MAAPSLATLNKSALSQISKRRRQTMGRSVPRRLCRLEIISTGLLLITGYALAQADEEAPTCSSSSSEHHHCSSAAPLLDCGLYMAESSIPNAGWGMYTARNISKNDAIFYPDLAIPIVDFAASSNAGGALWLMDSYYWDSSNTGATYEAFQAESVIPGLGMLANSHTGLVNAVIAGQCKVDENGVETRHDPAAGASTSYHDLTFAASRGDIPAGMELFVEYGDDWFAHRANVFGDIPLSADFAVADDVLAEFRRLAVDDLESDFSKDLWHLINQDVGIGKERIRNAVPRTLEDVRQVVTHAGGSTAMHSVLPNVLRSQAWLQQHGMCLDHIRAQPDSPISGRGAFATRTLPEGTVIAPAPLIHMRRDHLKILAKDEDNNKFPPHGRRHHHSHYQGTFAAHQLLLNYCYGHPQSSLLLFPYSPVTNYINHSPTAANAKLQWASNDRSSLEWLERPLEDLFRETHAVLLMEIVATREIFEGEEVLLDYGPEWQAAWDEHEREWNPPPNADHYVPASVLNRQAKRETKILKTVHEEDVDGEYPTTIMTVCYVPEDLEETSTPRQGPDGPEYTWQYQEDLFKKSDKAFVCDIIGKSKASQGETVYTARVAWTNDDDNGEEENEIIVRRIPRRAIEFKDRVYTANQFLRNAFRHEIGLPDDMILPAWRDQVVDYDAPLVRGHSSETCGMYMAESSIPNSGLGMYSAVNISRGSHVFYPDIVVNMEDFQTNRKLRHWHDNTDPDDEPEWLMDSYFWNADTSGAALDADVVDSVIPGLGMLANSHTGLVNSVFPGLPTVNSMGLHRKDHPEAGSLTYYHKVQNVAAKNIPAGMELFVKYGDDWFAERTAFGPIPLSRDFKDADDVLESFWNTVDGNVDSDFAKDLWETMWEEVGIGSDRIRTALPRDLKDVSRVREMGTAMASVPNAVRTPEWLEENGMCLDNIRPGKSTISRAGRGAFATRPIRKGEVIAPAPLVHLHKRHMEIFGGNDYDDPHAETWLEGDQLLLNYCYGHRNSSVILFPYSPATNYINHNGENPNAELRWSKFPNHRKDWLELSVDELMEQFKAGLILEFVALRDVAPDEEIFIDYGDDWQAAWDAHTKNWKRSGEKVDYVPAHSLNDLLIPVRTQDEQEFNPYPPNIYTRCYLRRDIHKTASSMGPFGDEYSWSADGLVVEGVENLYPCEILSRAADDDPDTRTSIRPNPSTYTARVEVTDRFQPVVSNIPRRAIRFYDHTYAGDQYQRDTFRHEIQIPDHLFPQAWLDRL